MFRIIKFNAMLALGWMIKQPLVGGKEKCFQDQMQREWKLRKMFMMRT